MLCTKIKEKVSNMIIFLFYNRKKCHYCIINVLLNLKKFILVHYQK